jgi:hypothetical protein
MTKAPQKRSGDRDMNENCDRGEASRTRDDNGKVDRKERDRLTAALRNNYQSTVEEGVPDAFQDLIAKLK